MSRVCFQTAARTRVAKREFAVCYECFRIVIAVNSVEHAAALVLGIAVGYSTVLHYERLCVRPDRTAAFSVLCQIRNTIFKLCIHYSKAAACRRGPVSGTRRGTKFHIHAAAVICDAVFKYHIFDVNINIFCLYDTAIDASGKILAVKDQVLDFKRCVIRISAVSCTRDE